MSARTAVQVALLPIGAGMFPPDYKKVGDAAFVVYAALDVVLRPMQPKRVSIGIALGIPEGMGALITPDPGLAELGVLPAQEMFGADDRSPIGVLLTWLAPVPADCPQPGHTINRGDVIARIAFVHVAKVKMFQVQKLLSGPGVVPPSAFANDD